MLFFHLRLEFKYKFIFCKSLLCFGIQLMKKTLKVALVCGGPSLERGISLNSARSVLDHLSSDTIEIVPFYLDYKKKPYAISKNQLYSNTPSDFDFKLQQTAQSLSHREFIAHLKKTDLVFPVMHGAFGEDGTFQTFLEKNNLPFIGSSSTACKKAFNKYGSNHFLKKLGFFTFPAALLKIYHHNHLEIIEKFFQENNLQRVIVKPASGGSSIGVFSVSNPQEAFQKASLIFSKRMDTQVVLEPFAEGREFTVIILQNRFGLPVAILPTEIETDYEKHQIFDFRKKYLPTHQVAYHCPPRFENLTIEKIQVQAEQLFQAFGMRDFGRFDGWVFKNGKIWFSDFNPISGMEQNSFLFQQASKVNLSHTAVLTHIVKCTCRRYGISFPKNNHSLGSVNLLNEKQKKKKSVHVLFGGNTSERQVSVMSGTNAWLKLRSSKKYAPKPFLLAPDNTVWSLPYHMNLNHTAEEIWENCKEAKNNHERLKELEEKAQLRLALPELAFTNQTPKQKDSLKLPIQMSLEEFIKNSQFVFIGLHGGSGENGQLQKLLQKAQVPFNGPDEKVSTLCMDKWKTSELIRNFKIPGLSSIPGKILSLDYFNNFVGVDFKKSFLTLLKELKAKTLIVKPRSDGCSSGIIHLTSPTDLEKYITLIKSSSKAPFIEKNSFSGQKTRVEMPIEQVKWLLFEKFIETDIIRVKSNRLKHYFKTGLIEITTAVLEKQKKVLVLNPSITVAENKVLSVEEKFQGGTGINITPPPSSIVTAKALKRAKKLLQKLSEKIGIKGYARIDAFLQIKTGDLLIIEINTLPALTPSTVLYHQGLAEKKPIHPKELIEELIANKDY